MRWKAYKLNQIRERASLRVTPRSFRNLFPLAAMRFHSFFRPPQKVSRSQRARTVAQTESRSSFARAGAKASGGVDEISLPLCLIRRVRPSEIFQLPLIVWRSMMLFRFNVWEGEWSRILASCSSMLSCSSESTHSFYFLSSLSKEDLIRVAGLKIPKNSLALANKPRCRTYCPEFPDFSICGIPSSFKILLNFLTIFYFTVSASILPL